MNLKKTIMGRIWLPGLLLIGILFLSSGCENVQMGVGFSGYDSSTGMTYSTYTSTGPYGNYNYASAGYGYYPRGYYGRPYGW